MTNLFMSVLTVFFFSAIITLAALCDRKGKLLRWQLSGPVLAIFYLICFIHILLPVEFGFQIKVFLLRIFNDFCLWFAFTDFTVWGISFTILEILAALWIGVSACLLIRYLYQYRNVSRMVSSLEKITDSSWNKSIDKIQKQSAKKISAELFIGRQISTPMGFCLFRKKILLPEKAFQAEEQRYILLHEYTHFLNRDLEIKFLFRMCFCFMWWNPLSWLISSDLGRILELRCDLTAFSSLHSAEKMDYLKTILKFLKEWQNPVPFHPHTTASLLGSRYYRELEERFQIAAVTCPSQKLHGKRTVAIIILFICILIFSYSFVPCLSYEPPEKHIGAPNTV